MKRTILIIIHLILSTNLYSITIEKIKDITFSRKILEYDNYFGTVTGYNNTLIMQNAYSLEELAILDDGTLNRVAYFETASSEGARLFLYEGKLYVFNRSFNLAGAPNYFFRVFDIEQSPMKEIINYIALPEVVTHAVPSVNFLEDYVYISFLGLSGHQTVKYNLSNLTFSNFVVPALGGSWIRFFGSIVISLMISSSHQYYLSFFELLNDRTKHINDFMLPFNINDDIYLYHLSGNNIIFPHEHGALVIDIFDIYNPYLLYEITVPDDYKPNNVIYKDEYMVFSSHSSEILIYQLLSNGQFYLKTKKNDTYIGSMWNLYMNEKFLFRQRGLDLKVYDIESEHFDEIYQYGINERLVSYYASKDNFYILQTDVLHNSLHINSTMSNIDFFIPNEKYHDIDNIWQFQIKNNIFAILGTKAHSNLFFDIYDVSSNDIKMIYQDDISSDTTMFLLSEKYVLLSTRNDINVFELIDNELVFWGILTYETLLHPTSEQHKDFIITYDTLNNNIIFRDKNELQKNIFNPKLYNVSQLSYTENIIINNYTVTNFNWASNLYSYDINNNNIHHFYTFPEHFRISVNAYNSIVTDNANQKDWSQYYTIVNQDFVKVGEKINRDREVYKTYFYPENKKMIEVSFSGISLFDICFKEYVTENDVTISTVEKEFITNYPNPFNPTTTIQFNIVSDGNVKIDIYNFRGQHVITVLDNYKKSGMHHITWNGKDEKGQNVSSGVYFYQMQHENTLHTRKMLLLK